MATALMDTDPADKTLAERAMRLLREDILAVRLAPGAKLRIVELQERYGLGISPLREALLRLASEGLVVAEGQRGFMVATVSLDDLEDLTHARICLETAMLREAVSRGDADWEASIVAAFHRLSRAPLPTDTQDNEATQRWETLHRAFHHALVAGCGSQWLLRQQAQLAEHSERYRRVRLFHSTPAPQLARNVENEHRALMNALLERDAPLACQLMTEHLRQTAQAVAGLWQREATPAPTPAAR